MIGPAKIGPAKIGPVKIGPVKIGPAMIGPAWLQGPVAGSSEQAGSPGGLPNARKG
jgi:hypothetical protein